MRGDLVLAPGGTHGQVDELGDGRHGREGLAGSTGVERTGVGTGEALTKHANELGGAVPAAVASAHAQRGQFVDRATPERDERAVEGVDLPGGVGCTVHGGVELRRAERAEEIGEHGGGHVASQRAGGLDTFIAAARLVEHAEACGLDLCELGDEVHVDRAIGPEVGGAIGQDDMRRAFDKRGAVYGGIVAHGVRPLGGWHDGQPVLL